MQINQIPEKHKQPVGTKYKIAIVSGKTSPAMEQTMKSKYIQW